MNGICMIYLYHILICFERKDNKFGRKNNQLMRREFVRKSKLTYQPPGPNFVCCKITGALPHLKSYLERLEWLPVTDVTKALNN